MADRKISELTNITGANLADDDEFALVDTSADETKAITFGEFKTALDTATGFVRITGDTMTGNLTVPNVVVSGNVDGRDVSADGTKLDTVETNADVTDTANVTAAGALMDSELANLAAVKAIDQGLSTSDSPSFDAVTVGSTSDPSSEMTILSSIGGTSELRLGDTDADAGSIKYFNSNDQLVLRAAAATRVIFSSTGAAITGKTTTDELDLNAIAATISDTAVDIFVYDTRKDSDGGAWRKRTQHTSWYNETLNTATRGSRKEFPAVAVIVTSGGGSSGNAVTIYDGDDPDLPMWMVFNQTTYGHCSPYVGPVEMKNGLMIVGTTAGGNGYSFDNFVEDAGGVRDSSSHKYWINKTIAGRNVTASGYGQQIDTQLLVNGFVNDVAMTVLPNAPIDAATGLPVPTIAVATDGGVSVIKDDGTVISTISDTGYKVHNIDLQSNGNLFAVLSNSSNANYAVTWAENYTGISGLSWSTYTNWNSIGGFYYASVYGSNLTYIGGNTGGTINDLSANSIGSFYGLTKTDKNPSDFDAGLVNFISSNYNTGWMNGDIKLATLSDTDATNVTGSELVTNGTFDTDTSGWTALSSATLSVDTNRLKMTNSGTTLGGAYQAISVTVGKTYTVHVGSHEYGTTNGKYFKIGNSAAGAEYLNTGNASSYTHTFTPTQSTVYLTFQTNNNVSGATSFVDDISVRLAEEDRSVNGNGLQVFGTVTKSAVATGADLVAYSGWSSSNYLEQPVNTDLQFGTNDWAYMGWFKTTQTNVEVFYFYGQYTTGWVGGGQHRARLSSGNMNFGVTDDNWSTSDSITSSGTYNDGSWHHYVALRRGGGIELYADGVSVGSFTLSNAVGSLSNTGATVRYGLRQDNTTPFEGSLALARISATAPSPDQILKIYNDEKHLFTEGAQATLYGSSDSVTALAYDTDSELLHVGTSAGRSVFQGLRRVDNTTTAVTSAISASNGLVADE